MMHKRWKKRMCMVLTGMICVCAGLYGCGSSKTDTVSEEKNKEETVQEVAEEPTATPTEAPTAEPTEAPKEEPTAEPTEAPTEAPTEVPTEVPTEATVKVPAAESTEQPASEKNEVVSLEGENLYKINIFLSNFAEQDFEDYDSNNCSDFQLISFAFFHAKSNNDGMVQYIDSEMCVSLDDINYKLERYLGKSIQPEENAQYTMEYPEYGYTAVIDYRDGLFRMPAADGEPYGKIAVTDRMVGRPDGTFEVTFKVYSIVDKDMAGYVVDDKSYYYTTPEEAEKSSELECIHSGTAVVTPYQNGDIDSYHLLKYDIE